ncbi:MAG: HAD family phosphatase [Synergistaceae bacterium]
MSVKHPFWHPSEAKAFILDWDGVIADTKLDFTEIRNNYFGGDNVLLLEEANKLPGDEKAKLLSDIEKLEIAGAENATLIDGAINLIDWLEANDKKWCIVSRNCEKAIEIAAKKLNITLPKHLFHRDNSAYNKPDQRAFIEAAKQMEVSINDCVSVGDFIYDIMCARKSGARSILVQRDMPEWDEWTDSSYLTLCDFVEELKEPKKLIPWEYKEIYAKRGERWFNAVEKAIFMLPDSTSPTLDCWLNRAAAFGIKSIYVDKNIIFTATDWKNNSSFPISSMGRPMYEVVEEFLKARFPKINVISELKEGEEPLKASKNSLDLMRFIERKIF